MDGSVHMDLELALAVIATERPRSVEQARKQLERRGFEFTGPTTFKAASCAWSAGEYEIGPDPLSDTGFIIKRKES